MEDQSTDSKLRRAARTIRYLPDKLLHGMRHRRALEILRREPVPTRILVVCHGNICRSPYGEHVLRRRLQDVGLAPTVRSAGFVEAGRVSPPVAVSVAAGRGVDLEHHRSRQLTGEEVRDTDVVIVMEGRQRRALEMWYGKPRGRTILLGDLDPLAIRRRNVRDPFGRAAGVFEAVFERVDRCLASLVEALEEAARHERAGRAPSPTGSPTA